MKYSIYLLLIISTLVIAQPQKDLVGVYKLDVSGIADPQLKEMTVTMSPYFTFTEKGIVTVSVGGELMAKGSYRIISGAKNNLSLVIQGEEQLATLSDDHKKLVIEGGENPAYIKQ